MKRSEVRTPSGVVVVEHDDDDTEEEIIAKAKHQEWLQFYQAEPTEEPPEELPEEPPAPEEPVYTPNKNASTLAGSLRSVAQGVTGGWGDEIESAITGTPVGQIRADMNQFSKDYGAADFIGQASGGLLTGALGGAAFKGAQALPGIGQKLAMSGVNGRVAGLLGATAGGAVSGAGMAEEGSRGLGAGIGAGIGLGVGVAAPVAIAALKKVHEIILQPGWRALTRTPEREVKRMIMEALDTAGIDPADAPRLLQEYGDEAMVMDLSPYLSDIAYMAQAGKGPGRRIINEALNSRKIGEQGRIIGAAARELKAAPDDAKAFLELLKEQRAKQAAPFYQRAHEANIRWTEEFQRLWDEIPASAKREAEKLARKEWALGELKMPPQPTTIVDKALPGTPGGVLDDVADKFDWDLVPDVKKIDYVKRGYDEIIGRALRREGRRDMPRVDIKIRNRILKIVDQQVPDFEKARGIWAGAKQLEDAVELGKNVFKEDADELADVVKTYGESERIAFRYGIAKAIRDKIETAKLTGDAVSKLIGKPKDRRILRAAFGNDEEFNRFIKELDNELRYSESEVNVQGNSATHRRFKLAAEQKMDIPTSTGEAGSWLMRHVHPHAPLDDSVTNRLMSQMLTSKRWPYGPPRMIPPSIEPQETLPTILGGR